MRSRFLLALAAAVMIAPACAHAGILGLGGHAGYFRVTDEGEKKFFAGAHARLRLPLFLTFEGALDYRPSAERTVNGPGPGTDLDVTTYPITISAMAYPIPIVYLLAGVGWYNTTIEFKDSGVTTGPDSETKDNFGSHFGAGIELPIGGNKSLSADVRYVFLNYDVTKLDLGGLKELDADYFSFQVGLTFDF
jgi:hypothetical protein